MEFFYRTFKLPGEPPMTRFLADAVAKSHWFDISAAKRDLGYTPKVSLEEGLHRLADWFKTSEAKGVKQ
jgi:nucleoside-diphosphate-sugar epimerase